MLIASKGEALMPIVLPDGACRAMRFAAGELRTYLNRICSADFRIVDGVRSDLSAAIFLNSDRDADTTLDGFSIKTNAGGLRITGRNGRSVLYGVYALLQEIGCIFAEPGIEHVPEKRDLVIDIGDREEVAQFAQRNVFRNIFARSRHEPFTALDPELTIPQLDWMAKKRLNHHQFYVDYYRLDLWEKHKAPVLDALLDRGFDLEVSQHNVHYFCPPDFNHDFGDYGDATYIHNHPDWYIPAGEIGERGRFQTHVEYPEAQAIISDRFLDYYRRNDELDIVSLWPDDIAMNNPDASLNPAEGYLSTFWNPVADRLAAELPGKRMAICAYFELLRAPQKIQPRNNLHCWFCPIDRDYRYPITAPQNRRFIPDLEAWCNCLPPGRVAIFEYYGWSIPFTPFYTFMQEDLAVYKASGAAGVNGWAGWSHNILGNDYRWALDLNVLAELLWSTGKDLDTIKAQWAQTVFRQAGGAVLEFYAYMADAFEKCEKAPLPAGTESFRAENLWLSLDALHGAQAILQRARSAAATAAIRNRIDLLEKVAAEGVTV